MNAVHPDDDPRDRHDASCDLWLFPDADLTCTCHALLRAEPDSLAARLLALPCHDESEAT